MIAKDYQKIRVFVASPSDVAMERNQIARVVEELNLTISAIAPEKKVVLELVRWETHAHPGIGDGPQQVITRQIGKYDIFIGILWKRMGTRTAVAASSTEEEFRQAYRIWDENRTLPILFYFCQQPFPPPRTGAEVRQLGLVVKFRRELSKMGIVADYATHEAFADAVRPHLLLVLGRMLSPQDSATKTADRIAAHVSESSDASVRQQIAALAAEYEKVRAGMEPGDPRTRKMEIIASYMRALAIPGYGLVPELVKSASPGMRLAATTFLQAVPNPEYTSWLAGRLQSEKPFVAYHAALALLTLVRVAGTNYCERLESAIDVGQKTLLSEKGDRAYSIDRYEVLDQARRELKERCEMEGAKKKS
jgi:hypothetical protein